MLTTSVVRLVFALALGISAALAHGQIVSHRHRMPGEESKELCGQDFNDHWNGVRNGNDISGPIFPYDLPETCQWYFCRGMRFADNADNLYVLPAGLPVHLEFFVLAAHAGTANVSVVDTARHEVIPGGQLRYWGSGYAARRDKSFHDVAGFAPSDQVDFIVDMPDLAGRCQRPGECVLQHWWWGKESAPNQYFESCIDFVQPVPNSAAGVHGAQTILGAPRGRLADGGAHGA